MSVTFQCVQSKGTFRVRRQMVDNNSVWFSCLTCLFTLYLQSFHYGWGSRRPGQSKADGKTHKYTHLGLVVQYP